MEMDAVDKRLLNILQMRLPLVPAPYRAIGEELGIGEDEVLARVRALRAGKILRQVSAIFDTRKLGYRSSLVAMRVTPSRVAEAARVINAHPGVSHNYERNHEFNLWFTIAVPPPSTVEEHVDVLHREAGAEATRILQTLRLFKIGVKLDMTGEAELTAQDPGAVRRDPAWNVGRALTPLEIGLVRELQQDLRLEPRPFLPAARQLGLNEEELLAHARRLIDEGIMRRFAAVLYHRKAGFRANAMGVWNVPDERVEELGFQMAAFAAVSHCYQRPRYPDWPYNIFTMVHGRTEADCEQILQAISEQTGVRDYRALYSTREYKKVRLQFYTDEYARWELEHLGVVKIDLEGVPAIAAGAS
ncbi:MAG: AsnC family transcriptional regulator [Chloroflexi bacterium]|mgnify:CR=1 FL=1|nr:AsnC family transcriptional regulator [Chloroflexota bacterium]